jgi:hypothetical protein
MTILMTAEVPGMTQEMVNGMTEQLMELQKAQAGFVFHANGPIDGGWGVTRCGKPSRTGTPGTRARSSRTCRRGSSRGSRPASCTTSCSRSRWPASGRSALGTASSGPTPAAYCRSYRFASSEALAISIRPLSAQGAEREDSLPFRGLAAIRPDPGSRASQCRAVCRA